MSTMSFLTIQQELASRLRLDINNADQLVLLKRWINQAQNEIWARADWFFARDRQIVQTAADITSGSVSVSSGGTTVTGASTSWTASEVGKFIQFQGSNDWYKVTAVASATSLTIEIGYNGTSDLAAGSTYTIRQFFYSLGSTVEKLLNVRQVQSPAALTLMHFRQFDFMRPYPASTGNPRVYVVWGLDGSNNIQISLYPWPSAKINLEVRFKKKPTDLSADADVSLIPEKWHSTVLLDGALYRGLEYVRTDFSDKRAESKRQEFEAGIMQMLAGAEPESDLHDVIQSKETFTGPRNVVRLPEKFDWRQ